MVNVLQASLIFFIYPSLHISLKYIGSFIYIVQIFSQGCATIINPGIPHRKNHLSQDIMETIYQNVCSGGVSFEKYRVCKQCNILVNTDENVIHCEECDICYKGVFN